MPYKRIEDLPDSVRDNLPKHAQEIYQAAFNSAWDQYDEPEERRGGASREETAHKVAWAAVKRNMRKTKKPASGSERNNKSPAGLTGLYATRPLYLVSPDQSDYIVKWLEYNSAGL